MEITQITTIKLEDEERKALQTLRDAYVQCATSDCFECDECPLYADEGCVGMYADNVLAREEKGGKPCI